MSQDFDVETADVVRRRMMMMMMMRTAMVMMKVVAVFLYSTSSFALKHGPLERKI